jgi:hypothetical protein
LVPHFELIARDFNKVRTTVMFGPVDCLDPTLMLVAWGRKDAARKDERQWWPVLLGESQISMPIEKALVDAIPRRRTRASEH